MEGLLISEDTMNKEPDKQKVEEIKKQVPKSFMSPAYVEEKEPGIYAMYRDILIETDQPDGVGGFMREKLGKRIGPMYVFRVCRKGEEPDFTTSKSDGTVILLWQTHPPKPSKEEQLELEKKSKI